MTQTMRDKLQSLADLTEHVAQNMKNMGETVAWDVLSETRTRMLSILDTEPPAVTVMITIDDPRYTPVMCDTPSPCPFCGSAAELCQMAHRTRSERIGRSGKFREVRYAIIASTEKMTADTFWFKCKECGCTSGGHHDTAQKAAEAWNRRVSATEVR